MSDAISKVIVRKVSLPLRLIFALKSYTIFLYIFFLSNILNICVVHGNTESRAHVARARYLALSRTRKNSPRDQPSIIRRPSSPRFRTISFLPRTDSYRSAHSRHTAGVIHIAAGGESIFIRPEIDRPRNESPHREGVRIAASSRRRAPLSSMRLHHPLPFNPFASARARECWLHAIITLTAHVIISVISGKKHK